MRVTAFTVVYPDGVADAVLVRDDGTLDVPETRRADALAALETLCSRTFGGASLAARGGRARAAALSPERRAEIARAASAARWAGRTRVTLR